jgi:hypothetical protein
MRTPISVRTLGSVFLVLALQGCGQSSTAPQAGGLPFRVIDRSDDAVLEASRVAGTRATIAMNAAALQREQNYRFKVRLEPGGHVELRMRAKADLSSGLVLRFARTDEGITMHLNGDDLTADVARVLRDPAKEIVVDFDVHDHGANAHGIYSVNGKEGVTADFNIVALQGTWGFVVENASVRDFAVGPPKHEH